MTGAYVALVCVCFFWGTTYAGIRMALESFPPLALVSIRFVLSGAILLIAAILDANQMRSLAGIAAGYGLAAIVEVHDEKDLAKALDADAAGAPIMTKRTCRHVASRCASGGSRGTPLGPS